jgi:hypothetical protein
MNPRKIPAPATAARSPHGAGRTIMITAIGIDICTSVRATCRNHHVSVVVSCSTHVRCRRGSAPPKAYHSQRCAAGRTSGSFGVPDCAVGWVMAAGGSCSTVVTRSWST